MKKIILLLAATATAITLPATPLTPEEALSRISESEGGARRSPLMGNPELIQTVMTPGNTPAVYLFSNRDNSIMFVGADDVAVPLLGYTESDISGEMPPQMKWWLEEYAREIEHANKAVGRRQFADGPGEAVASPAAAPARPAVWNFVSTKWDQDSPYNDLCPTVDGKHCYTGCTATAAAQIINYHKFPEKGTGTKSYTPNEGASGTGLYTSPLTLDLSAITFDWDNMLNSYDGNATSAQKKAVATLMQAVGYIAEMNYGIYGSGAASSVCLAGMKEYMGYNEAGMTLDRNNFSRTAWENMVYENIKNVGPVLYSGFNLTSAGHAFVCDGYYDGYFHFNWGWGGSYDGFFKLTALTPVGEGIGGNGSGDYSFNQNAVFNIAKPDGNTIDINIPDFTTRGNLTGSVSGTTMTVTSDQNWVVSNTSNRTIKATFALKIVGENGESQIVRWYYSYSELQPGYGFNKLEFQLPSDLADGSYKVYLIFKEYGAPDSDFQQAAHTLGSVDYVDLTVSGGNFTATDVAPAHLEISDFELLTPLYLFTDFKLSYRVSNNSGMEILDGVQPIIYTKSANAPGNSGIALLAATSTPPAVGDGMLYDLMPGESEQTEQTTGMTCYVSSVPSGQIYLGLRSSNTGEILAEKAVTLGAKPASPTLTQTSFSYDGDASKADANDLRFNLGVRCTSGYLSSPLRVYIFPAGGGSSIAGISSHDIFLEAGKSTTTTVNGQFPEGVAGQSYRAYSYYLKDNSLTQLSGSPVNFTISKAVSEIETVVEGESTTSIYVAYDKPTSTLIVNAPSEIESVAAYATDGRVASIENAIDDNHATISISDTTSGIIIVKVTLKDGSSIVEKLAK